MLVHEFGGEKKIIESLVRPVTGLNEVVYGPGDDCSVVKLGKDRYQVISSDMYVDGDHFSTHYFSPLQIGKKVVEATLSDIAAMGAKAKYLFLNLSIRKDMEMAFVRSIFRGIYHSCDRHQVALMGGDFVKSSKFTLSLTAVGEVSEKNLTFRSGARVGDMIKVTGELGGSAAGYLLFKRKYHGHEKSKQKHLEPACRLDIVNEIAPYATAMQDISDGLGSEVKHIAIASKVGAEIWKDKIPIASFVHQSAKALNKDVHEIVLYGGEDFELVYTVSPEDVDKAPGVVVGKITELPDIVMVDGEERTPIRDGFSHF